MLLRLKKNNNSNADMRGLHTDGRRFICENLRLICENLRLRYFFSSKFIIIILVSVLLGGCVTIYNPATGRKETLLIDTADEVALGRDMDKQIQNKLKVLNDLEMQNRLDYIGSKVSAFSDRKDLTYYFKIIKECLHT